MKWAKQYSEESLSRAIKHIRKELNKEKHVEMLALKEEATAAINREKLISLKEINKLRLEKQNLIDVVEEEKQKLIEELDYKRLKENEELRKSVNNLTAENSKLKRKLQREANRK